MSPNNLKMADSAASGVEPEKRSEFEEVSLDAVTQIEAADDRWAWQLFCLVVGWLSMVISIVHEQCSSFHRSLLYPNNAKHQARERHLTIFKSLVWFNQGSNQWGSNRTTYQNGTWDMDDTQLTQQSRAKLIWHCVLLGFCVLAISKVISGWDSSFKHVDLCVQIFRSWLWTECVLHWRGSKARGMWEK